MTMLGKLLSIVYEQINLVVTLDDVLVAMVRSNA